MSDEDFQKARVRLIQCVDAYARRHTRRALAWPDRADEPLVLTPEGRVDPARVSLFAAIDAYARACAHTPSRVSLFNAVDAYRDAADNGPSTTLPPLGAVLDAAIAYRKDVGDA